MSFLIRAPLRSGELAAFNPAQVDVIISAATGTDLFVKGRRLECAHDLDFLLSVIQRAGYFFFVLITPASKMAVSRNQVGSVEQVSHDLMFHLCNGQKVSVPGDLEKFLLQIARSRGRLRFT